MTDWRLGLDAQGMALCSENNLLGTQGIFRRATQNEIGLTY